MEQVRLERAGETKHPGGRHACSPRCESGWRVGFGAETWTEMRKLRWEKSVGKLRAVGSTGGCPMSTDALRFACDKDQTGHRVKTRLRGG